MSNQNKQWLEKRAKLERQLVDAKQTVLKYEETLRPYRTVTDSEYSAAKKAITRLYTEIHDGDYEAGKPVNPLETMSLTELQALYEKEKKMYLETDSRDVKTLTRLSSIDTQIQKLQGGVN